MIEKVKNIKIYKILIKFEKYKLRGLQFFNFFLKNKFTKNDYRSKRPYPAGDIQIHSEPGN